MTDSELNSLTPPERLSLINRLWDSLDAAHIPLTAAQRGELRRRIASIETDKQDAVSWETLRAEMTARYR